MRISLKEVLTRRIARMNEEPERFAKPELIIIDGGKGQLSAVKEVFDELGVSDIELISLAKKQEEIFTLTASEPIILQRNDYCLRMLQRIRDEALRFAITYHRTLRQKRGFYTTLSEIDGLGKKAINSLLLKFGSVAEIARATVEELEQTEGIGKKRATAIYQYFNSDKGEL